MSSKEPGILPDSHIYLLEPSLFSQQALIYVQFSGDYHCIEPYQVNRTYLDLFILFAIDQGQLELKFRDQTLLLQEGDLCLIDCKEPHSYRAVGELRFRWIHFRGGSSQQFFDHLYKINCNVINMKHQPNMADELHAVFELTRLPVSNDFQINLAMTRLLSSLVQSADNEPAVLNITIHRAFQYMTDHYREDLSLDDMAGMVNMSTCHFARLFRLQYNCPPHEYLLGLRLLEAKRRLLTTTQSVEEISDNCGFNSTSHFIRAFGKRVGKTPAQFRKIKF
jgi:AraC family transcriptional regulator